MTTTANKLFRETALEQLSSPEQLDQALQVTNPKGWASLIAIWVLLGVVVVWSIVGVVPTKEEGKGILVSGGGLKLVVAPGAGRLTAIEVEVGDEIAVDQVVARIDKHDIVDQLNDAISQLEELRLQNVRLTEFDVGEVELQAELTAEEFSRLDRTIQFSRQRLERLTTRRAIIEDLRNQGMLTDIDLFRVDEEMETAMIAVEHAELEKERLTASNRRADFQRERERLKRELEIEELTRRVDILRNRLERESHVQSPYGGRVVEVRAAAHTAVGVGDPILLIEPVDARAAGLEAILYVSAATGKRVKQGMLVDLAPSTVKREEHGTLRGEVTFIADVPTSRKAMTAVLSDAHLVEQFSREIGLVLEMRVSLNRAETPSGYEWSSETGPPVQISAGTLCDGFVTVDTRRPISFVMPGLRGSLDGG